MSLALDVHLAPELIKSNSNISMVKVTVQATMDRSSSAHFSFAF